MTRPVLSLSPDHRAELEEFFEDTMASLGQYITLTDAGDDEAFARARAIAAALQGVVHSSDTDCDYYPCVLRAMDPTSDGFFDALGIARDARASVSGWDNPKLEAVRAGTGPGERAPVALLTRLGDYELGRIGDYVEDGDLAAMQRALGLLEAQGRIVGVQLCTDDGASKVVLTLAGRDDGVYVGVSTIRVET